MSPRPKRPRHWTVQGPISGIARRRRSARAAPRSQRPAATSRASRRRADRAGGGEVHRLQFGRGAAGDRRRRGDVAQRPRPVAEARAPAADDAALDHRRPRGLDQLPDDRRGERLPGPGRAAAAGSAERGGSAARAAGRGGSGGGSRRGRSRRRARSASARSRAPSWARSAGGASAARRPGGSRRRRAASAAAAARPPRRAAATRSGAGCQARTRTGAPSTWSRRGATPPSTRRVRSVVPRGSR